MEFCDLKAQYKALQKDIDHAISRVLTHGKYILGPEVYELEEKLANYCGAKHCISVANGTDALQIALMSIGISPGDEIIMPAFSYIATAEAAVLLGAKPIYVDIHPSTFNMNVDLIEQAITSKTKAIIPVSLYGRCVEFDKINDIANRHKLIVIEDAAQSFGATYKGGFSCGMTDIACTSFFPSKPLGCYGDGGAIFTNVDELAVEIRKIARHGQTKRYHHERVGVNSRLDTIQAAILLAKLNVFENDIQKRQVIAERYSDALDGTASICIPAAVEDGRSAWAQYTLKCEARDELQNYMIGCEIPVAIHYPITLNCQPAVKDTTSFLPEGEDAALTVLSLPFSAYLDPQDQDKVISAILDFTKNLKNSID